MTGKNDIGGNGIALGLVIGAGLGVAYGAIFDNMSIGLVFGLSIGLAGGIVWDAERAKRRKRGVRPPESDTDSPESRRPQE